MKEKTFKAIPYILIVLLAVFLFDAYSKIDELNVSLVNEKNQHQRDISSLEYKINSIYKNVDEQMKKEASLFSGTEIELGDFDKVSGKVSVEVSVVLKAVSDSTEVSVSLNGETAVLSRDGNGFRGVLRVGLFSEYGEYPLVTVKNDGETKTEFMENADISNLWSRYLPNLYVELGGTPDFKDNVVSVKNGLIIETKPSVTVGITFDKFEIKVLADDREIYKKDITENVLATGDGAEFHYREVLDESWTIAKGERIAIYVSARDSLGYVHEMLAMSWEQTDGTGDTQVMYGGEMIYGPDGTVCYGGKEYYG